MDSRVIERLLRHVFDMAAEEISCSECFELLSVGVELELAGTTSAPVLTRLAQHLGQWRLPRTVRDPPRLRPGGASRGRGLATRCGPAASTPVAPLPHMPVSRHVRFRPHPTPRG